MGPGQYGTNDAVSTAPYKNPRKSIDWCGALLSLLMPWGMFAIINAAMTFSIRFNQPFLAYSIDAVGLIVVISLFAVAYAADKRYRQGNSKTYPNMLVFICVTTLLAWIFGIIVGDRAYALYTRPGQEVLNLSFYPEVDPSTENGKQYMDAGHVLFKPGSHLDLTRSMAFKNDRMYCVAPITNGSTVMSQYSFWAVGTDCCSVGTSDFQCGAYKNPSARGGYRLMNDKPRPYYRLAVQQAEAAYHIRAPHPLFFEWVEDPFADVHYSESEATASFVEAILIALAVQCFFVVSATLAFTKFSSQEPRGIEN